MVRWYCWVLFCVVAIFSTWAFPADGDVEGRSLIVGNENDNNEDIMVESGVTDEVDDDDEQIIEDGALDITGRHHRRRKPHKHHKDDSSASSEDKDNDEKKSKKTKCVCYGKKPYHFYVKHRHDRPGKPRPSSSTTPAGQGGANQSGCKTVVCNFLLPVKNVLSAFTANANRPNNNNNQRP